VSAPEDRATLGLTFSPGHWCAKHLEPFRETWEKSAAWIMATMGLFEEMVRRDDIIAAAGGDTEMLDRVLREFSPMCCHVGDETTARWTALALGPVEDYKAALDEIRSDLP
jgi:hypothetical protein